MHKPLLQTRQCAESFLGGEGTCVCVYVCVCVCVSECKAACVPMCERRVVVCAHVYMGVQGTCA